MSVTVERVDCRVLGVKYHALRLFGQMMEIDSDGFIEKVYKGRIQGGRGCQRETTGKMVDQCSG